MGILKLNTDLYACTSRAVCTDFASSRDGTREYVLNAFERHEIQLSTDLSMSSNHISLPPPLLRILFSSSTGISSDPRLTLFFLFFGLVYDSSPVSELVYHVSSISKRLSVLLFLSSSSSFACKAFSLFPIVIYTTSAIDYLLKYRSERYTTAPPSFFILDNYLSGVRTPQQTLQPTDIPHNRIHKRRR